MLDIIKKKDPTSTIMMRKFFVTQFSKRYGYVKRLCNKSIIENDCFASEQSSVGIIASLDYTGPITKNQFHGSPVPYRFFEFKTNSEKLKGFLEWLSNVTSSVIFQPIYNSDPNIPSFWFNLYIKTAYAKGAKWAVGNIRRDKDLFDSLDEYSKKYFKTDDGFIESFLSGPVNLDRLKTLYLRTFTDMKGITSDLDASISRILADGLSAGWNPKKIAYGISNSIDTIGKYRATILARTEIIRAHHLASVQTYRDAGIDGVKVLAEWTTARDSRVCDRCRSLDYKATGKLWSLDTIEGLIPLHPQCRCAALPATMFSA